jgi:hypothetical protein
LQGFQSEFIEFIDLNFRDIGPRKGFHPCFNRNLYGKIVFNLNLTGLCPFENMFWKNMVSEIKICCRASSVLAGQFWQTPPE